MVLVLVTAVVAVFGATTGSRRRALRVDTRLTVSEGAAGRLIPGGFLGLSIEYPAVEQYAGADAAALNPRFVALVRDIAGPTPNLRIGGDSTDWTWWPVEGVARPPGVTYTLTHQWLAMAARLTRVLNARLLLGINLEADSTILARAEADALIGAIGRGPIWALELGNEPELYGAFPWYRTATGRRVTGRPRSYNFAAFTQDFTRFAAALPAGIPLAGPTASGPGWMRDVGAFIASEPRVRAVTLHRYPLQLCFAKRRPTMAQLLADAASRGLAQSFAANAEIAHRAGRTLRVDELNTVSCGADPSLGQSFAAALWSLDTMFELARAGVDGVNIHTFPGAGYSLFRFAHVNGRWTSSVSPEYYGLRMFAEAAPAGSQLLRVAGAREGPLKAWAVRAPDGRLHVVLINKARARLRVVAVRVAGAVDATAVQRLSASSLSAARRVRLGRAASVPLRGGRYVVTVPAASAALLIIKLR